jgi:hypothetical protein
MIELRLAGISTLEAANAFLPGLSRGLTDVSLLPLLTRHQLTPLARHRPA